MKHLFTIITLLSSLFVSDQSTFNLEMALYDLPGVTFKKIDTPTGYESAYALRVKQPIDHKNLAAGYFWQRVWLSHKSVSKPTTIITQGYESPANRIQEITNIIDANQVDVEHRYFGESKPDNMNYDYLSLENVTADLHHINQLLRNIYPNDWVSSGISKGGQTTIFYRYFYPNDVDVSIPYVAPLNTSIEDKRIYEFLDNVGTKECRDKIFSVQKRLLTNSDKCIEKLKWYSKGADLNYGYLPIEQAFEYSVLEYPFSFWQWGSDCNDIPGENADLDSLMDYLLVVSNASFFADGDMKRYGSHYYQAGREMGYYGYDLSKFKGLIKHLPTNANPSAVFLPKGSKTKFDGTLTNKVIDWIAKDGNEFVYIYGANDTWTATGVKPSTKVNSLWFNMEGQHHGTARIKNLTDAEKAKLKSTVSEWLTAKPN